MAKSREIFSKTVLIILNGIFIVFGLVILTLGAYLKVDKSYSLLLSVFGEAGGKNVHLSSLSSISIALIVFGVMIVAVSSAGIIGTFCEVKWLVVLYGIVITVLLFGLIAFGVTAIVFKYGLKKSITKQLKQTLQEEIIKRYGGETGKEKIFTHTIDFFNIYFECCGVNNYTDFENAKWNRTLPINIAELDTVNAQAPISCCRFTPKQRDMAIKGQVPHLNNYDCAANPSERDSNYQKGCLTPMNSYLDSILLIVLLTTIFFGLILTIGSVASCCICSSMGKS